MSLLVGVHCFPISEILPMVRDESLSPLGDIARTRRPHLATNSFDHGLFSCFLASKYLKIAGKEPSSRLEVLEKPFQRERRFFVSAGQCSLRTFHLSGSQVYHYSPCRMRTTPVVSQTWSRKSRRAGHSPLIVKGGIVVRVRYRRGVAIWSFLIET